MGERGQKEPETQKIVTESLQTQRQYINFTLCHKNKNELSAVIVLKFKLYQTISRLFTSSRSQYKPQMKLKREPVWFTLMSNPPEPSDVCK